MTERERTRIDAGQTGDKVAFPDPAVAPLGTDAEAGGQAGGRDPSERPAAPGVPPGASDETLRTIDGELTGTGRSRAAVLTAAGLVLVGAAGLVLALLAIGLR